MSTHYILNFNVTEQLNVWLNHNSQQHVSIFIVYAVTAICSIFHLSFVSVKNMRNYKYLFKEVALHCRLISLGVSACLTKQESKGTFINVPTDDRDEELLPFLTLPQKRQADRLCWMPDIFSEHTSVILRQWCLTP